MWFSLSDLEAIVLIEFNCLSLSIQLQAPGLYISVVVPAGEVAIVKKDTN